MVLLRRVSTCLMVTLLGGGAWGCTSQTPPSTPAERAANPDSITKDNPGGDAINPVDAALERLLTEKLGRKIDKYETVEPAFADAKNWKRIRFFGYKTRGGFRYGKDPSYAAAVLYYWEAEDDAPTSCIEEFAVKAQRIADVFDLDVEPLARSMSDHRRGVEAVDWPAWEREWEAMELQRIAELKERQEKMRKRRDAAAKRAQSRRRTNSLRLALALKHRAKAKPDAATTAPVSSAEDEPKLEGTVLEAKVSEPDRPDAGDAPAAKPDPDATPAKGDADGEPVDPREAARKKRIEDLRRRVAEARRKRAERLANMTPEEHNKLEERRHQAMERRRQAMERREKKLAEMMKPRPAPLPKDLGAGDMPVIRTGGEFTTLFNRDRYLGAMVAYDSWPGTCFVQGFAVKVGSDEALAEKVLDRWLTEMAPILRWKRDLREQPEIENR